AVGTGRPYERGAKTQFFTGEANLGDGVLDRAHREHADTKEAVGERGAIVGEPAVVCPAQGRAQVGILHAGDEQGERRIQEGGVYPVDVEVGDAGVRVEATLSAVGIRRWDGRTFAGSDTSQPSEPGSARIADDLGVEAEARRAVAVDEDLRRPAAV